MGTVAGIMTLLAASMAINWWCLSKLLKILRPSVLSLTSTLVGVPTSKVCIVVVIGLIRPSAHLDKIDLLEVFTLFI